MQLILLAVSEWPKGDAKTKLFEFHYDTTAALIFSAYIMMSYYLWSEMWQVRAYDNADFFVTPFALVLKVHDGW